MSSFSRVQLFMCMCVVSCFDLCLYAWSIGFIIFVHLHICHPASAVKYGRALGLVFGFCPNANNHVGTRWGDCTWQSIGTCIFVLRTFSCLFVFVYIFNVPHRCTDMLYIL